MLHMKLVWREVEANLGYVVETAVGKGGPLFHICRVGSCLCNDDDGHSTAVAIVKQHNDALKQELLAAHRDRWLSDLPERTRFFVTKVPFLLVNMGANGRIHFSSGELLAYESARGVGVWERACFVNLKGELGFSKNMSLKKLIDDGVLSLV